MLTKTFSWAGWLVVLFLSLYFIQHNALRLLNYPEVKADDGYRQVAPFIITHVFFGMMALIIGPLQFVGNIRTKYTKVHRFIGKTYLTCVLIGGSAALYLATTHTYGTNKDHIGGLGLTGLGVTWVTTSAMAFWAVKKRNFDQHREWMIRSYTVTFGFTSFRLGFYFLPAVTGLTMDELGPIMSWACWAVPLFFVEVFLQGRKISKQIPTA